MKAQTAMAVRLAYKTQRRWQASEAWLQLCRFGLWLLTRPFVWPYRVANRIFKLDQRTAARNLKRLEEEVKLECEELFKKYGARIVSEQSFGTPHRDYATVVVKIRSLELSARHEEGSTGWTISGRNFPPESLSLVCGIFASESGQLCT